MSKTYIPVGLRQEVIERAGFRCEYCLLHRDDARLRHEVDHVIAEKHGGLTESHNLAYACFPCNRNKGSDIGSLDDSGALSRFFNPRMDIWQEHFRIVDDRIEPLTPVGAMTTFIFDFNATDRCEERHELQELGRYPTGDLSASDAAPNIS